MEVDTALALAHEADIDGNIELVALAPSDLLAAQTNLVNWCDEKVKSIHREAADLRENLQIAKDNKWRTNGLSAALARAEKRVPFYEKIKAAVGAGYLIVPNFPVDIFAMRVSKAAPKSQSAEPGSWGAPAIEVKPELHAITGISRSSLCDRRRELRLMGLIEKDEDRTRPNPQSGVHNALWRLKA